MGKKETSLNQIIASAVAATGLLASVSATAKVAGSTMPRGPEVGSMAGGCAIGPFPQTTKAGGYNVLCSSMHDAEKCLAFIKGHFNSDGSTDKTGEGKKMAYCLETLEKELGADESL